jgi:hypothetical protein
VNHDSDMPPDPVAPTGKGIGIIFSGKCGHGSSQSSGCRSFDHVSNPVPALPFFPVVDGPSHPSMWWVARRIYFGAMSPIEALPAAPVPRFATGPLLSVS